MSNKENVKSRKCQIKKMSNLENDKSGKIGMFLNEKT